MSQLKLLIFSASVGCLTYLLIPFVNLTKRRNSKSSHLPLPPGPKGKPIIGNLTDLPREEQWLKITEWAHEYGEVVNASVFGQHLVYLNSYEAAVDLFESRSSIYSNRIVSEMTKIMGADNLLSVIPYGDKWRLHRRVMHQGFNVSTSNNFKEMQIKYAHKMLQLCLEHPTGFGDHVKHLSSGVILESVYGIEVQARDDPYVRNAEAAAASVEGLISGAYLVDLFPILRHIPDWFPGATFKKKANVWRRHLHDNSALPFQETSKHVAAGDETPSTTAMWLHKLSEVTDSAEAERLSEAIRHTSGIALLAGYETTSSTIINFIFLIALYPGVQKKAQKELDVHVGRQRLPDFSDRENLPYVDAIFKEVIRLHPIVPLGIPHAVIIDDEYKGMRIPKGSAVFANIWAMTHDKKVYGPDADVFRPERFIETELRDPRKIVFGFGRRICPGRFMAENTIFIAICSILHAFNISKAVDKEGREIPIEARWVSGLTTHLEPFVCSINPRFEGANDLVGTAR